MESSSINSRDIVEMVEEELLHYLNQNIHLKQYKFIKIACGIIKSLRIRKSTGSLNWHLLQYYAIITKYWV